MSIEAGLIAIPLVVWAVVWVWALVELVSTPDEAFRAAGESKIVWVLLVVALQFFGLVAYLMFARPRIRAHVH